MLVIPPKNSIPAKYHTQLSLYTALLSLISHQGGRCVFSWQYMQMAITSQLINWSRSSDSWSDCVSWLVEAKTCSHTSPLRNGLPISDLSQHTLSLIPVWSKTKLVCLSTNDFLKEAHLMDQGLMYTKPLWRYSIIQYPIARDKY